MSEHATAKYYVDQSIDEPTFVGSNKNIDFNISSLSNKSHILLTFEAIDDDIVAKRV